jgi:hypothetical protein
MKESNLSNRSAFKITHDGIKLYPVSRNSNSGVSSVRGSYAGHKIGKKSIDIVRRIDYERGQLKFGTHEQEVIAKVKQKS